MERKPRGIVTAILLLIPYVGLLSVPLYNRREPEILGFPFFYWYQLLWIPITVVLIWLAFRRGRHDN
jgi:hypothetical protein